MSEFPGDLRFRKSHEWARLEDDGRVRVGISDHAQAQLGDMVYVELPEVGDQVEADDTCAVVESVKAASDIYAPISGDVVEVNEDLADAPQLINDSPYENGWLFLVEPENSDDLNGLLDAEAYAASLDEDE